MAATIDMESPSTELIFLGTGTSSSLPQIGCITAPPDSELPPCRTCLSTLKPEGRKNIRRNTSAALRVKGKDGRPVTIVIDAGKNFQAAAIEWFPKYGLRKIDALVITHAHADAMNGLDDLRGWTLRGIIQDHIDVYVSLDTFNEVKRSFPYLVAKEFASGGGDVPEFKFHIIHDRVPFEIGDTGVKITPIAVHHGRLFSTVDRCCENAKPAEVSLNPQPTRESITSTPAEAEDIERIYPYIAFGFKIEEQLVYISDVSHIPDEAWPHLEGENKVPVVVLDCLRLREHTSHVGLEDSIKLARRMGATRTYFTGFGHEVSHDEWVRLGEIMGGASYAENELTEQEQAGLKLMGDERGLWFRPSYDGMRVCISPSGQVQDDTYQ